MPDRSFLRTGRDTKSWSILFLLLIVVLVPTIGVLWFMNQAMNNERLAVRQKLDDVYRAQLLEIRLELQDSWQKRIEELSAVDPSLPGRDFAASLRAGLADGLVIYDTSAALVYPAPAPEMDPPPPSREWRQAERLEHTGEAGLAAENFAQIAQEATNPNLAARALLAQARSLVRADRTEDAVKVLVDELSHPKYAAAVDSQGRAIAPSALLRALDLLGDDSDPAFHSIAAQLSERLTDYQNVSLPSPQRRFLMKQLIDRLEDTLVLFDPAIFDTLAGEELTQRYLDSDPPAPSSNSLQPASLPGVWHLASADGTVTALFRQQGLSDDLDTLLARQNLPDGTTVELLPPESEAANPFTVSLAVEGSFQGWRLVLFPEDQALFAAAANQRINVYLLTGVLLVIAIVLLTLLVARVVERQMRLTQLKNNLLSTVSHELKTPLASMRMLVDTLLETGIDDEQRVREYLHLISQENARLSRLVESFLTFSKMEQNQQSLEKTSVPAHTVVEAATASVSERFSAEGCLLEVEISPDLPMLYADRDALVMVLINLLDNANKYSDEEKHVSLRASYEDDEMCFAVADRGVGLSKRDREKIFDRFYQVDQSLSRPGSGVGLGLSIVHSVVQAHGGSIDVESSLGEGSTFTIRLPIGENQEETSHE